MAFNLVAAQLNKISKKTVVGDLKLLETIIYEEVLSSVNLDFVTINQLSLKGVQINQYLKPHTLL